MAIADKYLEVTSSLTGEYKAECIEGVEVFKYFGCIMDRSHENWLAVLQNIRKGQQVQGRLGKMLQREGRNRPSQKVLSHGDTGGVVNWGRDLGVVGVNVTEARGSSYGVNDTGEKVEAKKRLKEMFCGGRWRRKDYFRERGPISSRPTRT